MVLSEENQNNRLQRIIAEKESLERQYVKIYQSNDRIPIRPTESGWLLWTVKITSFLTKYWAGHKQEIEKLGSTQGGHLREAGLSADGNVIRMKQTTQGKDCLKNENGLRLFNEEIILNWLSSSFKSTK